MPRVPAVSRDAFLKWADARWASDSAVHPERFVVAYQTKRRDQVRLAAQGWNRAQTAWATAEAYRLFFAECGRPGNAQPQQRRNHESAGKRQGRPNDRAGRGGREWGR